MSSNHLRKIAARSFAVFARNAGHAASAASMAWQVSAVPALGTVPSFSPVAGLLTSIVATLSASSHVPLT